MKTGKAVWKTDLDKPVTDLCFVRAGRQLAVAADQRAIQLLDARSGQRKGALKGHVDAVEVLSSARGGQLLASGGAKGQIRLWDLSKPGGGPPTFFRSQGVSRQAVGHDGPVHAVTFSPDGRWLATTSADGTLRTWNASSGEQRLRLALKGEAPSSSTVVYSPDGRLLAYLGAETVLMDARTGRVRCRSPHYDHETREQLFFSPDGALVATLEKTSVKLWQTSDCKQRRWLLSHSKDGMDWALWSSDGRRLFTFDRGHVRSWQVDSGAQLNKRLLREYHVVRAASWTGKFYATAPPPWDEEDEFRFDNLVIWDLETGKQRLQLGGVGRPKAVAVSSDGRLLAESFDAEVWVVSLPSGKVTRKLKGHTKRVRGLAFSPDNRRLASASDDNTVLVWSLSEAK